MDINKFLEWNKIKGPLLITLVLFIIVFAAATAAKPAIINYYFDSQETHSIDETRNITALEGYGKVIVTSGEIYNITPDYFTMTDREGQIIRAYITDKLNCIPEPRPGHITRIAGAWNPTPINYDKDPSDLLKENFYAVWIINGCD